ncbi:matrixin family metalloprotease [Aquimarina sediminis]|uniref:matrixin family metalloprotease n=1 Tax=Aquimarina sediminis TaxID=2070536 RepID=UPI000CA03438|nr:matrixin family metalloprotease [Aquimarina sediminis]
MTKTTKPITDAVATSINEIQILITYLSFFNRNRYKGSLRLQCTLVLLLFSMFIFSSCEKDTDHSPNYMEKIFVENPERIIKVNIIYVEAEESSNRSSYSLDEKEYLDYLNGYYFHRMGIGLELDNSKTLVNEELYDLRDNVGSEPSTFFMQSQESFDKDRLNIYIIKRSNIRAIAGMGRNQRVLLTDEHLYTSTSPHEIGHALGLFHTHESGNIMSTTERDLRQSFNKEQEEKIKKRIDQINLTNTTTRLAGY